MPNRAFPPRRLGRARASRPPKLAVTVFCEGKRTEPAYFREFAAEHGNQLAAVRIGDISGVPMTLVDAAVAFSKAKKRQRKDSFEKNDQVWIACDCDEHPDLKRAFDKARGNGIRIAYSNPCVELWAYLHFSDHDKPLSRSEMQRLLEKAMPKYKKDSGKIFDYNSMKSGYSDAHKRAEKMEKRRAEEGCEYGNPYTSVFQLMQVIFENGKIKP